jgi:heat shock protein HslJ
MKSGSLALFLVIAAAAIASAACTNDNLLSPSALTTVRGTEWSLVELNGTAVATSGRNLTLLLADNNRATGFAGCNQFSGSYSLASDSLRFSAMAMTRMFCAETADLEQGYVAALESTRAYRVSETRLELLSDQRLVAVFEKR